MTLRAFGQRVMRWGTGNVAARARIPTLTREELERAGLTRDLEEAWRDFYRHELLRNPSNPMPAGRAELMQRAVEVLPREVTAMRGEPETKEYLTSVRVCNARACPMTLYLEPWGEQYTMAPEATFTAVARGPEGDTLEEEVSDNHIILYGMARCRRHLVS